ncbi:MAG: hypothetical protein EAX95_11045 [Candidatus Thorarchaeota archaeon]|nr:hypothetical protein [Candidatus Thorarchaeota archaeon]
MFWAVNFDTDEYYQVNAYLLAIGDHCYIFFDDLVISIIGEEEATNRAEVYRDGFDSNIYSAVTDLAGNPDGTLGDVDGDPRIYILIVEHRQSYYRQSNEIEGEHSNMCEMVYICYRTNDPEATIAHEFHHLVWFNHEFDEVHFVLEGAAEYATYYSGYLPANNWTVRVQDFLDDIDDALIYFEVEAQDYGACYLFAFYLAEQYGVRFLRNLVQQEVDGARGLETALEAAGHYISFNELYLDWMTALTIDEQGFAEDRYCYRNIDTTIQDYTTIETLPYQDDSVPLYCYGSKVYQLISPPDSFSIEMSQPNDGVSGLSVVYRDLHGWHVQQKQEEGAAVMQVTGESLDIAHVIVSYLYTETPGGGIDFGSGPRETVQILIHDWNETTGTTTASSTTIKHDYALLIAAGTMPISATLIVLFLFIKKKRAQSICAEINLL